MSPSREQASHSHDQPDHLRPYRDGDIPPTAPLGPPASPRYEDTHSNSRPSDPRHRPYPEAYRQPAGHSGRTRSGIPFVYLPRPGGSSFPAQSGTAHAPLSGASREFCLPKDSAEEARERPGNYSRFQPPTTPPLTSRQTSILSYIPTDVPESERQLPCNRLQVALIKAINDVESGAETDYQRHRRCQRERDHRENYRERFVGLYSINGPLWEDFRVAETLAVKMNFPDGRKVAKLDITLPGGGIKEGHCLDIVALYKDYTRGDIELFKEWGQRVGSKRRDGGRGQ
jgi:hypothetical protein